MGNSLPSLRRPIKIEELSHRSDPGLREIMRLMFFMDGAEAFGNENGVGHPDEFLLRITEHLPGAAIDQQNDPGIVDDDDPFRE